MRILIKSVGLLLMVASLAQAGVGPEATQKLLDRVRPSLVAVQYTWESELGKRELSGAGIVVREDGLIICQLSVFDPRVIPDEQLTDFKVIVPDPAGGDSTELDAKLLGRDDRYNLVFVQPKEPSADGRKWTPIKFEDVAIKTGETVMSVGILAKMAGYQAYFVESDVSASLRGETPQVLVQGGLTSVGSPVFNSEGKAVGIVNMQDGQSPFLNMDQTAMNAIKSPPRFYLPARDFLPAIAEPPQEGKPIGTPWVGIGQMNGLEKEVAEVYGLVNQPAIQIGDVIAGMPAEKAGLKRGDVIVKVDGQPLERGDVPEELPDIFRRKLMRLKGGQVVKLGVMRAKGEPMQEIALTLGEMPKRAYAAKRWYAEDLGFSSREMVFSDRYEKKLPEDAKGVVVALVRPQSAAQTGRLAMGDVIRELNREPVTDLEAFKKSYEAFRKDKPKEAVVMVVLREGNTQTIRIEPPQ